MKNASNPRPKQKTKADRQLLKSFSENWRGYDSVDAQQALAAVRAGGDASWPTSDGLPVFLRACRLSGAAELVQAMARAPGVCELRDGLGRTGLHLAAAFGVEANISPLVAAGLLEAKDDSGETPVAAAINAGKWPIALALANFGADLLAEDHLGVSALRKARARYADAHGLDAALLEQGEAASLLEIGCAQLDRREILSGMPPQGFESVARASEASSSAAAEEPSSREAGLEAQASGPRRRNRI